MPYHYLLQKFLDDTGWPAPANSQVAERMQTALSFFHKHMASWVDLALDQTDEGYRVHGFNPFAFKINGKVTKLISNMQGINFNQPVQSVMLQKGKRVIRYGSDNEPRGIPSWGLCYTEPNVSASQVAIKPDQVKRFSYEVLSIAPALSSIAGDMLVDWNIKATTGAALRAGIDYHYRAGRGLQYHIPSAGKLLRPL